MKAYRVTLLVIDSDELGGDDIASTIENQRYPNHCINPQVVEVTEADIGEWDDDHPLNRGDTWRAEYDRLFAPNTSGGSDG